MSLSTGSLVGPYEIVSPLGVGGMGEVYRARDSKLNREVALKILPPTLADDPDRLARFRREAQVLAALNHPNIAHIHGFEDSGATHALVMELVEGQTLAERIAAGAMPLADALPIARQIAEALEAAHEQGIIHRDLKPANVKVRDDGTVKVLDFGLAKALDANSSLDSPSAAAMNSPTLTARATQLGVILGTAAYMAPEQAKGRPVDRRADIWAFGVVLFEMISGRRGYEAADISETLAAVLTREVDWTALPAATPARLKALIRDCLVRDPKQRLRDIGDARRALERMIEGQPDDVVPASAVAIATPVAPAWRRALPWAVALAAISVAAFTMIRALGPAPAAPLVTRAVSSITVMSLMTAVSRDGTKIAYTSFGASGPAIVLRMSDQFEGQRIAGSEDGGWPVFSPKGDWIAYSTLSNGKIKKISVTGGAATSLGAGEFVRGAAWGDDETIVFSGPKGLMRVAAEGGTPESLTTIDAARHEAAHIRPQFLPDGRHLLFTITVTDGSTAPQFAVLDLATGTHQSVAKGGLNGQYQRSGHLTYVRDVSLFAVPFDLKSLTVTGPEVPVVEGVSKFGPAGTADYAVSSDGLLAYFSIDAANQGTTLAWADRAGKSTPLPGESQRLWGTGRMSPDGRFVANAIESGTRDIWVFDVVRGIAKRLTFEGENDIPIWTSDSRHIYYWSSLNGQTGISRVAADGSSSKPVLVLKTDAPASPSSLSADNQTMLYTIKGRIMMVTLSESGEAGTPKPLHDTTSEQSDGQISPDGKWVAYVSMETGAAEIYAHAFPGGGAKVTLSAAGGARPRWTRSGRELLYWTLIPSMALTAISIPPGSTLAPGPPTMLFPLLAGTTWDVTPDPDRFLIELTSTRGESQLAIVTNWFEELRRKAPAKK